MEGQAPEYPAPQSYATATGEKLAPPMPDEIMAKNLSSELEQSQQAAHHHATELERNQRVMRACRAALNELESANPVESQVDAPGGMTTARFG